MREPPGSTAVSTAALIWLIAASTVLTAVLVATFVGWLIRLSARNRARLEAVLSTEPAIRGPERATYRGSTGGYSRVSASGLIALTRQTLVFRKSTGGCVDVPLADVTKVRVARQFGRARVGP